MTFTISVIGTGYLGAVHAVCMASLGHRVVAVDSDIDKIAALAAGTAPLYEPGFDEMLSETLASGRLQFTTDYAATREATVHFVCVGTPQREGSSAANTDYVYAATRALIPYLHDGDLVVGKSTVPVGTAADLQELLGQKTAADIQVDLLWNPEFLRESHAIADTLRPDRLVYGVEGSRADRSVQTLDAVYAETLAAGTPRIVTDFSTAELVKVSANAFLATKISFINAMSEVCEAAGGDVSALAESIGLDERIGSQFLAAGVGFGGGCLPKDIRAFQARATELGVPAALQFLSEVDEINERRQQRVLDLASELTGGSLQGKKVAVLGAAFKPNSDDIRESPALAVAKAAGAAGAVVRVHDPKALPVARSHAPDLAEYCDSLEAVLQDADVVLHLTEWSEYQQICPEWARSIVAQPALVDGRNTLDLAAWQQAGWQVQALGRPRVGQAQ